MKRRWIVALTSPVLLVAGCDSVSFLRPRNVGIGRASLSAPSEPHPDSSELAKPPAATEPLYVGDQSTGEEPAATDAGPSPAAPGAPAAEPPAQLASASIPAAAKRTVDAFMASLPRPGKSEPGAQSANSKVSREIAAFKPYPFTYNLPTTTGTSVNSQHFSGSLMIVDIWATWCGPCRKSIPDFVAIQDQYASQGVQVVGITCDSADPAEADATRRKAIEIANRLGINYPLLIDDGTTTRQVPGFRGYPTTLFLTPDGVVVFQLSGAQPQERLAAIIDELLQP